MGNLAASLRRASAFAPSSALSAALSAVLAFTSCGERAPPPHVGKVTPAGRVFEKEDFRVTVPLRFTGFTPSAGADQIHAEQAGLREARAEVLVALHEIAIESGMLRIALFDGTSNDYERADQIVVHSVPSGQFTRADQVIADQRTAVWLDAEPVKWERLVVSGREVDRLHTRMPKLGTESVCYYLDGGETTYMVVFATTPERADKIFAESETIMKSFEVK